MSKAMKKFVLIEPGQKTLSRVSHPDLPDALGAVGLEKDKIDFGDVAPGHSIVVYEYGMFVKPEDQQYFSIGRNLYAGNAVVLHENVDGHLVDVTDGVFDDLRKRVRFFDSSKDVEAAIKNDEITQPSLTINGEVLWVWPQSRPDII